MTRFSLITSDAMLINEMSRWTALRYNGVPADQAAADLWYEIEDYQPKTERARADKAQFLRQFPYVALKRSEFGERLNKAADAFERRNERIGAKLCA
ncbi:hypothetical protein NKW43_14185 [Gluconobacter albidus]|uniref:hypothetical protein n=1 Tax=Gluconobacter albidus TaxID=318683 RepID=UPI00209F82E8|nr:hypothetical protein [Gluconobacter albidus]MCP1274817.1 hypothetical protein [Gluconobacter albidus]